MPVTRTYLCSDCALQFSRFHMSRDEPAPECPRCEAASRNIPGSFSIGTVKGKAIDAAYAMAEQQYGITDLHDNSRAGDIAAVAPPPVQSAEAEAIARSMVEAGMAPELAPEQMALAKSFWQNGATPQASPPSQLTQAAMANASLARAEGVDPVGLLHARGKAEGGGKMAFEVVGSTNPNFKPGSMIAR